MRILLIGETGTGKTVTALSLSKFFRTVYYDVDLGTELWKEKLEIGKNVKIIEIHNWQEYKQMDIKRTANIKPDLIVVDSISELYERYKDYVQDYVRKTGKFPMPVATGVVDLLRKGIDPEFITIPMQMYGLLYDTILNVVTDATSNARHSIITMHPLETRMAVNMDNGSMQIIHSSGKLSFLQGVYRKVDIILKLKKPLQAQVLKARGEFELPEDFVNPIEYLKEKLGIGGEE